MGAVFSSAGAVADAARAAKHYRQRRLTAPQVDDGDHDVEKCDYWSALPDDLLFTIMAVLDVQSIRRSGAVCTSWRHAHTAFNLAALEKAPCLLYACEEYGPNDLALYCPTTDATFRVPFPGQPHYKRGFTFSCPGGWVFTTDEVGDPYLINPLTGVQAALPLPPVKTIYRNDHWDEDGKDLFGVAIPARGILPEIRWARHAAYLRVAISAAADVTKCTVLIVHLDKRTLSFARPGNKKWTLLSKKIYAEDILYNDKDGLFYILHSYGSVSTLDLRGPSPSRTTIMRPVIDEGSSFCDMYLVLGPSGKLLQVWRNWDTPRDDRFTYQDTVKVCENCVEFADDDQNDHKLTETGTNEEEEEIYEAVTAHQDIDDSQVFREGIDLPHRLADDVTTTELLVFEVDIEQQKLVERRDIGDHALFLGRNSAVCLSTKEFPVFEPNCAYLTSDCFDFQPTVRKDLGIWNIKKRSMKKLDKAWPNLYHWLHLPAPIWITPKF